jgi:hypothetical protein
VVQTSCGHEFTFQVEGPKATTLSTNQDVHDPHFDNVFVEEPLAAFAHVRILLEFLQQYKPKQTKL